MKKLFLYLLPLLFFTIFPHKALAQVATPTPDNIAPVVEAITGPIDVALINSPIYAQASFTDENITDTHTALWNWGDGNMTIGTLTQFANGRGIVMDNHVYSQTGVYTITLIITDNANASGITTYQYVTVTNEGTDSYFKYNANEDTIYATQFVDQTCSDFYTWAVSDTPGRWNPLLSMLGSKTAVVNSLYTDLANNSQLIVGQTYYFSEGCYNYQGGQYTGYHDIHELGSFVYQGPPATPTPTIVPTHSITGNIYTDTNDNGFQDEGESGFAGATVALDNGQTAITDQDGNYTFNDLQPSTYIETLITPTNYIVTTSNPVTVQLSADTIQNFGIRSSTITLNPVADSYIKQGSQNENEGASTFMRVQSSGHNRALVKFDQSQIQAAVGSSQNYTAELRFTISDNGNNWGNNGRTIEVHRLLKDWTEGNGFIDGNSPSNRGTGSGVTWNCATDTNIQNSAANCSGSTIWNMDNSAQWPFVAAVTAFTTITNNQSGTVTFDVTSDVQSFVNNTNQNYGWLFKKTDEGANGRIQFGTKESANAPTLVITLN